MNKPKATFKSFFQDMLKGKEATANKQATENLSAYISFLLEPQSQLTRTDENHRRNFEVI